jgi:hypothetical protein
MHLKMHACSTRACMVESLHLQMPPHVIAKIMLTLPKFSTLPKLTKLISTAFLVSVLIAVLSINASTFLLFPFLVYIRFIGSRNPNAALGSDFLGFPGFVSMDEFLLFTIPECKKNNKLVKYDN